MSWAEGWLRRRYVANGIVSDVVLVVMLWDVGRGSVLPGFVLVG